MKVRFDGREYKQTQHREDLFSPGATHSASRVIDFLALKMDAYFRRSGGGTYAEYLERLAKAGRDTDTVWRLRRQLQSWVEHVAGILVNKLGFARCTTAPQFYWSSERMAALVLDMDDIHGAATSSGREKKSSNISHWKSISREVTDVRQESHTNISNDYDCR